MDVLEMVGKKRTSEENARREKIRELQMANDSVDDIQDLFKETIAEFMENGLKAEIEEELGYSKYDYKNRTPATAAMDTATRDCIPVSER